MKKVLIALWSIVILLAKAVINPEPSPFCMAIFKSLLFGEIRNKMAGIVFSRNKAGAYVRQRVSGVNPKTVSQQTVRTLMTTVSQAWKGITAAQRLAWNQAATTWVHINVFNDNAPLSGFGLYCRLNRNLQTTGTAMIDDVPIHSTVVGMESSSLVADTTAGTLTLTFAPAIVATQYLLIYGSKAVSPGVNFVKSEYRLLSIFNQVHVSPLDVAAQYIVVFGALPGIGDKVFIKAKPMVFATGQDGVAMEASDIAV